MADSSPLAGLLDRAGNVFSLAGKLGRAFHEEHQGQSGHIDPTAWSSHASDFEEYCDALLDLRDAMQSPPEGFALVAKSLLEAARIAKGIRNAMQRPDGQAMAAYLDFFPYLNTVCENGWQAIKEVSTPPQPDDPFAFVDETPVLSLLDRFPDTAAGHVAFLEFVRDEVHYATEAKRAQFERGYPNETLESMVRGIKWDEASQRVSKLSELPADVVEMVSSVLRRELSVGTVEQIDELLTPPLRMLRSTLESASLLKDATVVEPPELIELKRWISLDGIKGHWEHTITAAEYWGLEVDSRHRNIAFLLQQIIGGDPPESAIRDYLFRTHGILPSDPINLVKLEEVLKHDAEQSRTGNSKVSKEDAPELIRQLLTGPDDTELSDRELALLEAHLKQPVSMSQMQREAKAEGKSESAKRRNKLKLIRDFNRKLRVATPTVTDADSAKDDAENRQTITESAVMPAQTTERGNDDAEATKPTGGKPATVNERMAGTIMENPEAMGWNSAQWAKHLKCGKSSVVETATWKKLESARLQAKAERMKDRRRKPKASDSRRD